MITPEARQALEEQIHALWKAGDLRPAATLLFETYGDEIFGFLVLRMRDRDLASEVFSEFAEDVWRGFEHFRWECTARVWCYSLARHATCRQLDALSRRRAHNVPLSQAGPLSELAERIRTDTRTVARTETRNRLAELRETLPVEDQTLLLLRVSRRLGWRDVARVMLPQEDEVDDAALDREAVRLRKRYQLAKERLKHLAIKQGLVSGGNDA